MKRIQLNFIASTTLIILLLTAIAPAQAQKPSPITGHWEGTITREGKEWRIWLDIESLGNGFKGTMDGPDYGLYAMPLTEIKLTNSNVRLEHSDRSGKVSLEGNLAGEGITGEWQGIGVTAPFRLTRIQAQPITFIEEEIRFQNGDATLVGTLVKPNRPGKFSAVVCTHGSGNQTRTEDFYRSRAYLFARHGIAALIYDRRGKGASTGADPTFINLADDALAGVRALKMRSDINPRKIGVSGFSQGGWVSPLAAFRSKDVAFVIVGSTPGITPDEQNNFAVENDLRAIGLPEEIVALVMSLRRRVSTFQNGGAGDQRDLEAEVKLLKGESWFKATLLPESGIVRYDESLRQYMSFDPGLIWEKVSVPVLSLWGESDRVVPAEESRAILERALRKGGNKDYTLKIFPGGSHGIAVVRGKGEPWDWPRLVPGYQEMMIDWLLKRFGQTKQS